MKYLVNVSDNWADEMDVEGFSIWDQKTYDEFMDLFNKYWDENGFLEIYIGTNEFIEYGSKEDLLNCFKFIEITDDEAYVLKQFFGESFGDFNPDYIAECLSYID